MRLGRRAGGGGDLGPGVVHEPIEALLASVDADSADSALRGWVRLTTFTQIAWRARINAYWEAHPEVQGREITRPLFIAGHARTGTTLLLNLLAAHEQTRPLLGWEGAFVVPPKPGRTDSRPKRWARHVKTTNRLQPELSALHELSVSGPEEDVFLHERTFLAAHNLILAPGFGEWIDAQTRETVIEGHTIYRRQIEILDAQVPGPHWLIKSPQLLPVVDMLAAYFPDATVIQTHRDARESLPSMLSLADLYSTGNDWRHAVRRRLEVAEFVAAHRASEESLPFVDVEYSQLIEDPYAVCAKILDLAGLEPDSAFHSKVERYLSEHPQGRSGEHKYSLEQFGIDEAAVEEINVRNTELFGLDADS